MDRKRNPRFVPTSSDTNIADIVNALAQRVSKLESQVKYLRGKIGETEKTAKKAAAHDYSADEIRYIARHGNLDGYQPPHVGYGD